MICFTYETRIDATILFDGQFKYDKVGTIDELKAEIINAMKIYGFDTATVIDLNTGEIILEAGLEDKD